MHSHSSKDMPENVKDEGMTTIGQKQPTTDKSANRPRTNYSPKDKGQTHTYTHTHTYTYVAFYLYFNCFIIEWDFPGISRKLPTQRIVEGERGEGRHYASI